ncbi:CaiB/BaiF CoA transferase family protein [Sandaracinus amylolyticus]|uniref:CaiB/BaiF CoA transferase family protein n=1 Tax=Sandaracinus amylolyticus TaxID=927083 RepID=UPI001F1CBC81|nr:CaiB/BaiF CoA-transferase family protein [Sandaracinus amylolyticus]UJR79064.1 L-carnitine dehydratase/bile acid-inducible protein F [Sandaracinus amylolyticus]
MTDAQARTALTGRPLSGLRILDLSRLLPGPFASMILADLGAAVDKVEDPSGGDYLRFMPPMVGDAGKGTPMNAAFHALNRGKRSLVLDLKKREGQEALLRLVPRYDVLIESFRPGVMERLGLGFERLRAASPGLVYCAITGFGQDGPAAQRAGHDIGYIARAGVLGLSGPETGPPQVPGVQMADMAGGALFAVSGILAALHARTTTGEGRFVDVSMCEGSMVLGAFGLMAALAGDGSHARGAGALNGGIAPFGTYRTKDGRAMALGALEPKFWVAFCTGVGIEPGMDALMPGPHQEAWKARLRDVFASKTFAEWITFSEKVDCCLEPVLAPEEVPSDPQHVARKMFVSHDASGVTLPMPRTPIASEAATGPAPTQGRDTRAVLRDAGWSEGEIDTLIATGAAR